MSCRSAERPRGTQAGFALIGVLLVAGLAGLLAAGALREARLAEALTLARQAGQAAFALAQAGLSRTIERLRPAGQIAAATWSVPAPAGQPGHAAVSLRTLLETVPVASSATRFTAAHLELQSSATAARGARALQTEGLLRLQWRGSGRCRSNEGAALMVATASGRREARLHGGATPGLTLRDAHTGRVLWSAAASGAVSQHFTAMQRAFGGSLAPLDLDADGLHDRLYAGDAGGRVWRFDLRGRVENDTWATGGVFADLGGDQPFDAAPDLTLLVTDDGQPRLQIGIGTAAAARNHFYVLHDHAVFEQWSGTQYSAWTPLRPGDLAAAGQLPAGSPGSRGYLLALGSAQVRFPALTVEGRTVLATLQRDPPAGTCGALATIHTFAAFDGAPDGRHPPAQVPMSGEHGLQLSPAADGGYECRLAATALPACDLRETVRTAFWRIDEPG